MAIYTVSIKQAKALTEIKMRLLSGNSTAHTFREASECATSPKIQFVITPHTATGSRSGTSLTQTHWISAIRVIIVVKDSRNTTFAEILT